MYVKIAEPNGDRRRFELPKGMDRREAQTLVESLAGHGNWAWENAGSRRYDTTDQRNIWIIDTEH